MDVRLIRALLVKEMKDIIWNGQLAILFVTAMIMIVVVFTFKQLGVHLTGLTMFQGVSTALSFIGFVFTLYAQGNVIVEEKEQHTAGVLRLSKVQYINVFLAKAILVYGVSYLLAIFAMVINGFGLSEWIATSFFIIPFLLMCLFLGTILGEVAKNTIDVSLYGWPILLVYFTIEGLVYSSINVKILFVLPNYHMERGLFFIERGEFVAASAYIFVPILWMLLAFLYLRKKRRDATIKGNG